MYIFNTYMNSICTIFLQLAPHFKLSTKNPTVLPIAPLPLHQRNICPMSCILMKMPKETKIPAMSSTNPTWSVKFRNAPADFVCLLAKKCWTNIIGNHLVGGFNPSEKYESK